MHTILMASTILESIIIGKILDNASIAYIKLDIFVDMVKFSEHTRVS